MSAKKILKNEIKDTRSNSKTSTNTETRGRPKRVLKQSSETRSDYQDFSDNSMADEDSSKSVSKSISFQKRPVRGRPPLKEPRLEIEDIIKPALENLSSLRTERTGRRRQRHGIKMRPGRKSMEELRDKYTNKLMDIWNAAREIKVNILKSSGK